MADERVRQGATPTATAETDAVCERCGTVNPEETLLCKTCGNNLREQRSRRLAATQAYEGLEEAKPRTRWLAHLLAVFGLLIIVWTALNVNRIADWLVQAQTTTTAYGEDFFTGSRAAAFDRMAADLGRNPVTQNQVNLAMSQSANPTALEGRYALMRRGMTGPQLVGQAIVRREGGDLLFAAKLDNGVELRGIGRPKDGTTTVIAEQVGIQYRNEYAEASGGAMPNEGLGYAIIGITNLSDDSYEGMAYAIPESTEAPAPATQ